MILKQKSKRRDVLLRTQDELKLPGIPGRIEGLDISNIGGESAAGSVAVFIDGKPAPSRVQEVLRIRRDGPDGYAMISGTC